MQVTTLTVSALFWFFLIRAEDFDWDDVRRGIRKRPSYEGRHFLLALPSDFTQSATLARIAFISTEAEATVKLLEPLPPKSFAPRYWASVFVVRQDSHVWKDIDAVQRIDVPFTGCSMIITSSANIVVQVAYTQQSGDMLQVPPVTTHVDRYDLLTEKFVSSIMVVASQEYTEVKYRFAQPPHDFRFPCAWNSMCKRSYWAIMYLNASTFSYIVTSRTSEITDEDLSGTKIETNKPVGVIVGNRVAAGPTGQCSFTSAYGYQDIASTYVVISDHAHSGNRLLLRIISRKSVSCHLEEDVRRAVHVRRLKKYSYAGQADIDPGTTFCVLACGNYKVHASLFSQSPNIASFQFSLIPNKLWPSTAYFARPLTPKDMIYTLSIVVHKAYQNLLTCNGVCWGNQTWLDVPKSGTYPYAFLQVLITKQMVFTSLKITDPRGTLAAYVMGNYRNYSRGMNLGSRFRSHLLFSPCIQNYKDMEPGDGIDNDCDSQFDEEIPNGIDDDNDTMIDEDLFVERVDGDWSDWTDPYCDANCTAPGHKVKRRACNDPEPQNKGAACEGPIEVHLGKCPKQSECPDVCPVGKFSPSCDAKCSSACSGSGCSRDTGTCYTCIQGVKGPYCTIPVDVIEPKIPPIEVDVLVSGVFEYEIDWFLLLIPFLLWIFVVILIICNEIRRRTKVKRKKEKRQVVKWE